jgi:FkbM family methyltransferase
MAKTLYLPEREEDSFKRHCRLIKILTDKPVHIFDVGANVGQSIKLYRDNFPDCFITSFEPNPEIFYTLKKNWGNVSGITLNSTALSNSIGNVPFYVTRVPEVSSLLKPTERMIKISSEHKYDYKTVDVPALTIDHYCRINNINKIDILKLDVQGFEIGVLEGAETLLHEGKIMMIYSEVTFAETYMNQARFADLVSCLNRFNYEIWDIGSFLYTHNERLWAANITFLHKSAAGLIEKKQNPDKER